MATINEAHVAKVQAQEGITAILRTLEDTYDISVVSIRINKVHTIGRGPEIAGCELEVRL